LEVTKTKKSIAYNTRVYVAKRRGYPGKRRAGEAAPILFGIHE
jgi:hypothetical protein